MEEIHLTTISLYSHDDKPAPGLDEVLVCSDSTTTEEVKLLCTRAFGDQTGRIFTVLHAEKLDYETSVTVEKLFLQSSMLNKRYRIVFIFNKNKRQSGSLSRVFGNYLVNLPQIDLEQVRPFINRRVKREGRNSDVDSTFVRMLCSARPGMGKTLLARRIAERHNTTCSTVQTSGKFVDYEFLIKRWLAKHDEKTTHTRVFHLDLTTSNMEERNDIVFQISILGGIQTNQSDVWICSKHDIYLFEMTLLGDNNGLIDNMPVTQCLSPSESIQAYVSKGLSNNQALKRTNTHNLSQLMDYQNFLHPNFQRPTQYLDRYYLGEDLDDFFFLEDAPYGSPLSCLQTLLRSCPVQDPSFSELFYFASFLNNQLKSCEQSIFCNLGQEWTGLRFKNFVVNYAIIMAKDLTTRSVEVSDESEGLLRPEIIERRRWENNHHPFIFFNNDSQTMRFFGFWINENHLIDPITKNIVERNIMSTNLLQQLKLQEGRDRPMFNFDMDSQNKAVKLRDLCLVFGVNSDTMKDPDPSYELTMDNMNKMLAIFTKMKSNIPIIIMGETGCGKTKMISYMSKLFKGNNQAQNMITMKVHGGVNKDHIYGSVRKALLTAENNQRKGIPMSIMFFDEANTSEAISTIKEIMVDRMVDGTPIHEGCSLQFIAAVNPYRQHSTEMITKLENAGLGYYIQSNESKDKIGNIPLRRLVYRVNPMPRSMFPLIWDFGNVTDRNEARYIAQMIETHVKINTDSKQKQILVNLLSESQAFMRMQKDECSFVSLRDVERTIEVYNWIDSLKGFLFPNIKEILPKSMPPVTDFHIQCLLSLSISYYVRLDVAREKYSANICKLLGLDVKSIDVLRSIFRAAQETILQEVKLDETIAKNEALVENTMMMCVCIQLRIPLFLVGKPGSSKSLSKSVVNDIMQGKKSDSGLFRNHFKEIQMFTYQCSPISTSESILGIFRQCQKFQENKDLSKYTTVVVLDEIGLAEDSKKLPLKILHPLLEDGCVGDETPSKVKKVAFVGISNWALDPAKMNRGILLSRTPPDKNDLIKIGKGIAGKENLSNVDGLLSDLASGYMAVYSKQKREYYGLRDYYSVIKGLTRKASELKNSPRFADIEYIIRRNFGGHFENFVPADLFLHEFKTITRGNDDKFSHSELIQCCLQESNTHSYQSRYILFLTKNQAALQILQMPQNQGEAKRVVMFGSSFSGDHEYSAICENINKIKIYMETGVQVVLSNLDNLYESLYDALNMNYVTLGLNRYVDLGLGTHRVKCRVHRNFKLFIVAEDREVHQKFPIPLINRLEKHYLGYETILPHEYFSLADRLRRWTHDFSQIQIPIHLRKSVEQFSEHDVFIGYHADVVPLLILQVLQERTENMTEEFVFERCKTILLQNATPDSIFRVQKTKLSNTEQDVVERYFGEEYQCSMQQLLKNLPDSSLAQVTTFSTLLSVAETSEISQNLGLSRKSIDLIHASQFRTEKEFSKRVEHFFENAGKNSKESNILVVQLELLSSIESNMVDCIKFILQDKATMAEGLKSYKICMVVQLPRIAGGCFNGFPGHPWQSYHLDQLVSRAKLNIRLLSKSTLAHAVTEEINYSPGAIMFSSLVQDIIPKAASKVKVGSSSRHEKRVQIFYNTFTSIKPFREITLQKICKMLMKREEVIPDAKNWLMNQAISNKYMKEGKTFSESVWQYIQDTVTPLLTSLIANIDQFGNLDILADKTDWKKEMFLRVYRVINIEPNQAVITKGTIHNLNIPFSWLFMKSVDACLDNLDEETEFETYSKIDIGDLFVSFWKAIKEAPNLYLQDLIQVKHVFSSFQEVEVIARYLKSKRSSHTPSQIHRNFKENKEELKKFSSVIHCCPTILNNIVLKLEEEKVEQLQVEALDQLFNLTIQPDFALMSTNSEIREDWKMMVMNLQPLVEEILSSDIPNEKLKNLECQWVQVKVLLMYFDIVLPPNTEACLTKVLMGKVKMLWQATSNANFQSFKTFNNVTKILQYLNTHVAKMHSSGGINACVRCLETPKEPVALPCGDVGCQSCLVELFNSNSQKRCPRRDCENPMIPDSFEVKSSLNLKEALQKHIQFRSNLTMFFMKILEQFCFGNYNHPPDENILKSLLQFVTIKDMNGKVSKTKDLSPFNEYAIDSSPVVRSFLLQLCLQCDTALVKKHVEMFFEEKSSDLEESDLMELCLLYVCCIEDSIAKRVKNTENEAEILTSVDIFKKFDDYYQMHGSSIDSLDATANLKFAFVTLARVIISMIEKKNGTANEQYLVDISQRFLNTNQNKVMKTFLVKELCLKYRQDATLEMKKLPRLIDLLPIELQVEDPSEKEPDLYLVLGDSYIQMRKAMYQGILSNNMDAMKELVNSHGLNIKDKTTLFLHALDHNQTILKDEKFIKARNELQNICQTNRFLDDIHLRQDIDALLTATTSIQAGNMPRRARELHKLKQILKTSLISNESNNNLSHFLQTIIANPKATEKLFWPTMPHDTLFEAVQLMKNDFGGGPANRLWLCPNGHLYQVGDCGALNETRTCMDCGLKIGRNQGGQRVSAAARPDTTQTGFVERNNRDQIESMRNLSKLESEMMRMILNTALLAAYEQHPDDVQTLLAGKDKIYLLQDIDISLGFISTHMGKSQDAVIVLLCHLCNQLSNLPRFDFLPTTHAIRVQWETAFVEAVIRPAIKRFDEVNQQFRKAVEKDDEINIGKLHRIVYSNSKDNVHEIPHVQQLWQVRQKSGVESLLNQLDATNRKEEGPILYKLLSDLDVLSHIANLSVLMDLPLYLQKIFHHSISLSDLENTSTKDFIEENCDSQAGKDILEGINVLFSTWNALQEHLKNFDAILALKISQLPFKVFDNNLSISNTPASFIFPSSHGTGICFMGLLSFLISKQNSLVTWDKDAISPTKVSKRNVVSVSKEQIQNILLANTRYSFEQSGSMREDFNLASIDRQVQKRFLQGCPRISDSMSELPLFTFLEDKYLNLDDLLAEKILQKPLPLSLQNQIDQTLASSLPNICSFLDAVSTARNFLLVAGGEPNNALLDYMKSLHLVSNTFTMMSKQLNQLKISHVDSLLRYLLLLRAKLMILNGQCPFTQIIPADYKEELSESLLKQVKEFLLGISHHDILSTLFVFIWTQLRNPATGEDSERPAQKLKDYLSAFSEDDDDAFSTLPNSLLVKHSIAVFHSLVKLINL